MLENKESLKSTYSHRAVGKVLSIKVSLACQTTCSKKKAGKEGEAGTSPPSDILGGLDTSCWEALSGLPLPSSFSAPAAGQWGRKATRYF